MYIAFDASLRVKKINIRMKKTTLDYSHNQHIILSTDPKCFVYVPPLSLNYTTCFNLTLLFQEQTHYLLIKEFHLSVFQVSNLIKFKH